MKQLNLANGLRIPVDIVTESVGILAKRRAGKSTTARRLTEQLFTAKQQVVVVDPKGDWWGLLFDRSGKGPGLPFIVLGGEHGHAPLQSGGGEIVGRLVVEQHVSLILDLSQFRKHEIATFMADFMETLYRLKASEKYRTPVMLVIDEADAIAPQRPQPNEARMLGAAEDLVRRGGQRGIGVTLITQRAAVLNKNVLTQIGVLIVLRTIAPQDRKAMDEWITAHGTPEQRAILLESLSSLPTGTAWVWSPGWPDADGIFQKVDMLLPETFDSSSTPKAFANRRQLANAAPVDLEALRERMADAIAHAKENDPGELKKTVATLRDEKLKLQRQLDSLRAETPAAQIEYVDKPVLTKKVLQQIEKTLSRAERVAAQLKGLGAQFDDLRLQVLGELQGVNEGLERSLAASAPLGAVQPAPGNNPLAAPTNSSGLPSGELAVLRAIAQHAAQGLPRPTITLMTGYMRSTRDAYIQRLVKRDLVRLEGSRLYPTSHGMAAVDGMAPLPTGQAAIEYWRKNLPAGESELFDIIAKAYPKPVARPELQAATNKKRSTVDAYVQRLDRRELIAVDRDGIKLADQFFHS